MASDDRPPGDDSLDPVVAEFRRAKKRAQGTYRARALRLMPHVCAHCGREFEGPRLRELTVHHKDVDPTNNPPDGSNWELLCLHCHDHEHGREFGEEPASGPESRTTRKSTGLQNPFSGLADLLKDKDPE